MSKIAQLKSRLNATKLADMVGKEIVVVYGEVVPPKGDDGYPSAVLTSTDGIAYRSTSAAVIDFVEAANDVLDTVDGVWEEPVTIVPKEMQSKRGRTYLTVEVQ